MSDISFIPTLPIQKILDSEISQGFILADFLIFYFLT